MPATTSIPGVHPPRSGASATATATAAAAVMRGWLLLQHTYTMPESGALPVMPGGNLPAAARRARALLQSYIFPVDLTGINSNKLLNPGSILGGPDPNMPFGGGHMGRAADAFLSTWLNSPSTMGAAAEVVGPSFGGPVPVAAISPAINPAGNVISTGHGPGGAFVRAGPGGLVSGTYGGGWRGPFNTATGTYGLGGSYGFAAPYYGDARGVATFAVSNATYFGNVPTISYPCPMGVPPGTMISVGIPCNFTMISLPAARLPTINGLPAAPLLPTVRATPSA